MKCIMIALPELYILRTQSPPRSKSAKAALQAMTISNMNYVDRLELNYLYFPPKSPPRRPPLEAAPLDVALPAEAEEVPVLLPEPEAEDSSPPDDAPAEPACCSMN